jgi:hypothetical protein
MKAWTLSLISLVFAGSAYAQQTYPLTCRGGGVGNNGLTLGLSTVDNSALVYYSKAPVAAPAGLQPGQCSWQDRPIGVNEPPCLRQAYPGAVAWIFASTTQRQNSYLSSPTGNHWMRDLLDSNKFVTFQAYNPGNGGCFVITRLGF